MSTARTPMIAVFDLSQNGSNQDSKHSTLGTTKASGIKIRHIRGPSNSTIKLMFLSFPRHPVTPKLRKCHDWTYLDPKKQTENKTPFNPQEVFAWMSTRVSMESVIS